MIRTRNPLASMLFLCFLIFNVATALIFPAVLHAKDDEYPPGTVQMTPKIDLELKEVPLIVPKKFQGMVRDNLTLNLPSGFSVKVFAVEGLRAPRMMAFNTDEVLHVANMKADGASEFQTEGNSERNYIHSPLIPPLLMNLLFQLPEIV